VCAFSSGRARSSVLGVRPSALIRSQVPGTRHRSRSNAEGRIPSTRDRAGGTGYRIRCSAFGSRPSAWTKHAGRSHLPCPLSLHGRGPDTEHRRPSRKRAHGVCILHPASCILHPASCILHPYIRSRVPDTWDPIPGTKSTPRAGYRAPRTEPEGQEAIRGCGRSHPFLG
jgi:hypothetical protein